MSSISPPVEHPLLRCLADIDERLDDVAELDPTFLPTRDKERALLAVDSELARLEGIRLRLLASAHDVAEERGARSAGTWLAAERREGAAAGVRAQLLADALARWSGALAALAAGRVNAAQAAVVVRALDGLPRDLDAELLAKAEAHLVAEAGHFAPRELEVLGRRVLDVVAPDIAEAEEERRLRAEEQRGRRETRLTFRHRGDGVTDVVARVPHQVAQRLRTYLDAFTAPRRTPSSAFGDLDVMSMPRRRGEAFCSMLEQIPSDCLPSHGGTATSVMVMVSLETLRREAGVASLSTESPLSAAEVRRLACSAGIIPVVLGGASEILDLGRTRRLFSPAQRKAMAVRDRRCREENCDIPAAWCEAHHAADPWNSGGRTDLRDGVLLCSFHHHRAHDARWRAARLPNGDVRFARRT
jgi:Domain of unknown function (DUF222)